MSAQTKRNYVVIVAGGQGLRMGHDLPKQFIPIAGKPVLMHTLEAFVRWDEAVRIVLVLPEEQIQYWKMLCQEIGCTIEHQVTAGGQTRFHSVRNGLMAIEADTESSIGAVVGVHDGVRPFVSEALISRCFAAASSEGGAIPVVPVTDSLRYKPADGGAHSSVDRSAYFAVQTPQVFTLQTILNAYEQPYSELFTDDASVVEAAGGTVAMVEGSYDNIKLTTPADLKVAEWKLTQQQNEAL